MKTRWGEAATFPRLRRGSLVQEITAHLRRQIVSGQLPVGRRLPPIARLAPLYGVSIATMHAAIHAVESLGLVRVRHGVGIFVERPRSSAAVLNHAWMRASQEELAFMRLAIETEAATAAASVARSCRGGLLPPALRDLPFLASELVAAQDTYPEHLVAADMAFHRAMLAAVPDAAMLTSVHRALEQQLATRLIASSDAFRTDRWLGEGHKELATVILDGLPKAATHLAEAIGRRELG